MKRILISILIFLLIGFFTSFLFIQLVPHVGGLTSATEPIFWMQVFTSGELAVCTYLILTKKEKIDFKHFPAAVPGRQRASRPLAGRIAPRDNIKGWDDGQINRTETVEALCLHTSPG